MKNFKKKLFTAALLLMGITMPLNTAVAQAQNLIVFIPKLSGNAFFESANDGAQQIASENDFEVRYDGNPEASVANQVTIT